MEVNSFIPYKHFNMEGLHLLKEILKQGNYLCRLDLKGAFFLCSIELTVKKLCTFRMGRFPVRIPLSVFWPRSKPKVVYKINKIVSLHPLQTIYKNNSITQRLSNTRENFGGNNLKQEHCDLPVIESRICYKLKERSFSPNTENRILVDNNRLGGDDSVPASEEGRINFQKVLVYIVNEGGVNKRPSKAFRNIIINSISNSSCTTAHEVLAETTISRPLFEKRLHHQSSSRFTLQEGTQLVDINPKSVK